jgi:hypothetical protein
MTDSGRGDPPSTCVTGPSRRPPVARLGVRPDEAAAGSEGSGRHARSRAEAAARIDRLCTERLIFGAMERTIDDLPLVRASTLVANGLIKRDATRRASGSPTAASNTKLAFG